jgi:hypothetical protein
LVKFNKSEEAEIQRKILAEKVNSSIHINEEQQTFFLAEYKY